MFGLKEKTIIGGIYRQERAESDVHKHYTEATADTSLEKEDGGIRNCWPGSEDKRANNDQRNSDSKNGNQQTY